MLKSNLREKYKNIKQNYTLKFIREKSILIKNKFIKRFINNNIKNIHIYIPIIEKGEVNTWFIINELLKKNINLFIPKLKNKNLLNYKLNRKSSFLRNNFGIWEPNDSILNNNYNYDIIIIPLLIFDKNGYRVGYGGGYYDRFLSKCNENAIKIGISFENPISKIINIHNYDIKLDYCITPNKIYNF